MRLCAESFPTLGAFVRFHSRVEPLVFQKFKTILEAPPAQRTVMRDPSSGVRGFDGYFPRGHRG